MKLSWNFRKRIQISVMLVLALAFVAMPIASRVRAQDPDKITVALVLNTSDYNTVAPLVEQWSEETGIEVEVVEENTQTYASTYILAARTGDPPLDVVMFWDFYLDQLYPMLTPLDGSEDAAVALSEEDYADFLELGLNDYQGHPYILPYSLDTRLLYYREDLLEEAGFDGPPKTWDELVEYAQALTQDTDGDGNIDQWGFASLGLAGQVFNTYTFFDFLFQNGGQILDEEGNLVFNSEAGVEALQFMVDLKNVYEVMPPDVVTYDNNEIHEGFLAGQFAMVNHWPYLWGMIAGSDIDGLVGYTYQAPPADGMSMTTFNRWGFGIPITSENKAAAWDLIHYVTNTQSGIFEYSQKADWPLRASVYASEEAQEIPERHRLFSEFIFGIAETSAASVILPRGGETSQILGDYIDRAMAGQMSPQEALDAALRDINDILE